MKFFRRKDEAAADPPTGEAAIESCRHRGAYESGSAPVQGDDQEAGAKAQDEAEAKNAGCKLDVLALDVTNTASITNVVKVIATNHGYLDAVVNNAGYGVGGFFEDLTDEEIRQQMEVNFFGVQNVTRAVIPLMRSRRQSFNCHMILAIY